MREQRSYLALLGVLGLSLAAAALLMLPRLVPPTLDEETGEATPHPSTARSSTALAVVATAAAGGAPFEDMSAGPPGGAAPAVSAAPGPPPCPDGMAFVEGAFCPFLAHRCVERVAETHANKKRGRDRRCQTFSRNVLCEGRPANLHYCIDRYEYPNIPGAKPVVLVDYPAARQACAAEGKRLCFADEWMFACEGREGFPYPYGLGRDPAACNVDGPVFTPDKRSLRDPALVSGEMERIDGRIPSGGLPRCTSPFGVVDMSGNVAEWVWLRAGRSATPPFESSLAGGSWGPSEATCRAVDSSMPKSHSAPQIGFRCCRDALDGGRARRLAQVGARLARHRELPLVQPIAPPASAAPAVQPIEEEP